MQEGAMLRTQKAAEFLGVASATLCKWRVFGGGPLYKKLGRVVVYDPSDLRAWLALRSRGSTSAAPADGNDEVSPGRGGTGPSR